MRQPSKKTSKNRDSEEYLVAWDGRKVKLGEEADSSSRGGSSSAHAAQSDQSTDKLKDIIQRLVSSGAQMDPELTKEAQAACGETEHEKLRREQREFNRRRRELTKTEKRRNRIDTAESKFATWKENVGHTVRVEETRLTDECRKLRHQLSLIEKGENIGDSKEMDMDKDDEDEDLREAMRQQDRINRNLMEQNAFIANQLQQLTAAMGQIALNAGVGVNTHLEQKEIPVPHGATGLPIETPCRSAEPPGVQQLREELGNVSEEVQEQALRIVSADPDQYDTPQAIHQLVQQITGSVSSASCMMKTPPRKPDPESKAMQPFGKHQMTRMRNGPYSGTPPNTSTSIATPPEQGGKKRKEAELQTMDT